jgi:hypothetical protein
VLNFEDIQKQWDNLSEVEKFDILGYVTALLKNQTSVSDEMRKKLEQRLENFQNNHENAVSWGFLYNQLLKELI